jgi:hypothetical protein
LSSASASPGVSGLYLASPSYRVVWHQPEQLAIADRIGRAVSAVIAKIGAAVLLGDDRAIVAEDRGEAVAEAGRLDALGDRAEALRRAERGGLADAGVAGDRPLERATMSSATLPRRMRQIARTASAHKRECADGHDRLLGR